MGFFATYEEGERRRRREEDGRPLQWWESILGDYPHLKSATDEHVLQLFGEHSIDERVGRRRPYCLYNANDWEAFLRADPLYATLSAKETKGLQKKVAQRPGVVIARHGLTEELFAQYRPFKFAELDFDVEKAYGTKDEGVFTRWTHHDHEKPVYHTHSRSGHFIAVRRRRFVFDDEDTMGYDDYLPDNDIDIESHIQTQHDGVAPPLGQSHRFYPSWGRHVQRRHGGKYELGQHRHAHFGKYQYAPGKGRAKGVDVHPDAWALLERGGEVVYVAAEGCLKADAILSERAPVVGYGSVTLSEDSGWPWLARQYLSGFSRTVVVPDSDWSTNSAVKQPTLKLVDFLAELGLDAIVAAPPQRDCMDCGHQDRVADAGEVLPPVEHKYGVDDWLAEGHELTDVRVQVATGVAEDEEAYSEGRLRRVLEFYATDSGVLNASSRWLADRSGLSPDQVDRLLAKLERRAVIRLDPGTWSPSASRRPPRRITVLSVEHRTVALGEYIAQGWTRGILDNRGAMVIKNSSLAGVL